MHQFRLNIIAVIKNADSPECIRMSYATSDENIVEAMRRIKEALAELK